MLGSEECVDQSRKGRLNHGSIACANNGTALAMGTVLGKESSKVNVIRYASDGDRHHRVLTRDPAQLSMQSIPHLFPDRRLSPAGAEHQVNQAKYVTMRHENQPSLTGLVFLAHCTQHWFGAFTFVLILYSLYAPNRTGLLSGRPCGTLRYKQR